MLKILQAELQQYMIPELPDVQTGFRKGRGTDQIANIHWAIIKAFQKIIYFSFVDYAKGFKCVDHNKLWKILKEMGIPDHLTSWKTCVQIKKQQLEQDIEQWTDSKLRKEYIRAVHCHSTYLTYMQSTWWEILGWMTHKLESRLLGEIPTNLRWYHSNGRKQRELKSLLMWEKQESEKVGSKFNIPKTKIMTSSPITSWWIGGKKLETVTDFIFLGSKITAAVTAVMTLKCSFSLQGKLWPT